MIVLIVSIGIRAILKIAAAIEAKIVLIATGIFFVISNASKAANVPVFAAVSPNRLKGPWSKAGKIPL